MSHPGAASPPAALNRLGLLDGEREVVVLEAARRALLVVDRRVADGADGRLVARIGADEPADNATLIGSLYLADARRPICRPLRPADFNEHHLGELTRRLAAGAAPRSIVSDRDGNRFRLAVLATLADRAPEVRWVREPPAGTQGAAECVSARRVVGALEDYEPVRSMTSAAIDRYRRDPTVSIATLGLELRRLGASPIVLNRRLREAVLDASVRQGLSLSSIALACGRSKLDRRGRHSGETSWLTRRVGLVADDGGHRPNPWVHTDVLALIARNGLGIAPHEVELG